MIQIGIIDANDMLIEARLDGRVYHLGMSWNEEGKLWTLSIRDLNFSFLVSGIAVVSNWPLLQTIRRETLPPGEFGVDASPNLPLGRKSFVDGTARLFYITEKEIADASL